MKYQFKEIIYYFFKRLPAIAIGKIKGNLVHVHWGKGFRNFGDCLAPIIMKHYGLTPVYVPSYLKADVISAGSVLQNVPKNFKNFILGTGSERVRLNLPNAKIMGVRGIYTADCLNLKIQDVVLGDPGLLFSLIIPKPLVKKYKLGIVLHFVDHNQPFEKEWKSRFSDSCVFINVFDNPLKVIRQIASCEYIASSSLHGLIIADSYHIPNIHVINLKTRPRNPYDQKFQDYYSALGIFHKDDLIIDGSETEEYLISSCTLKPVKKIEQVIENLNVAHIKFAQYIKNQSSPENL